MFYVYGTPIASINSKLNKLLKQIFKISIMKRIQFFKGIFLSVLLSSFISCTDEIEINDESYFNAVVTDALAGTISEQAITEAEGYLNSFISTAGLQSKQQKMVAFGPKIWLETKPGVFPETYIIDFGDGYTNANEITYRGRIIVTKHDIASRKRSYEFTEFYINKNRIHGGKTVEVVEPGVLFIMSEEKVEPAEGKSFYRYSERTRTRINDNKTPDYYADDSFSFTGYTKGSNSRGIEYSLKIDEPLISVTDWRYFISGTMVIETERGSQHLDFGKGELDNIAISTIKDNARKIELKW